MSSTDYTKNLSKQPCVPILYGKALFKKGNNNIHSDISKLAFSIISLQINRPNLTRYIKICGFIDTGYLPITYPFVICFPLLMKILTSAAFPVPVLGLIHYKNQIIQYKPIKNTAALTLVCRINNDQTALIGRLINIHFEVFEQDKLLWKCISTFLSKAPVSRVVKRRGTRTTDNDSNSMHNTNSSGQLKLTNMEHVATYNINSFTALNYASVSGDLNPIHLHKLAAKMFGFKASIMHGMWAKARVLATLSSTIDLDSVNINVQFIKPILLPTDICLKAMTSELKSEFCLTSITNEITHLSGVITHLNNEMK
jgi:hypothetical protein